MLYDKDGVGSVAQTFERVDESSVVALMEPNRRFVENIKHIDQLAAELCGQAYALALAA